MKAVLGRRAFVGGVVAGAPILVGAAVRALPQTAVADPHAHPAPAAAGGDALLEHITREIARIHNTARREGWQADAARAFATQLRTLVVYGRSSGLDERVRASIARLVEQEGRDTVMYHQVDAAFLRQELARQGFELDDRVMRMQPELDYATRARALDALLSAGPLAAWDRVAANLEQVAPQIERRFGRVVPVAAQDAAYWEGFCTSLWGDYAYTQAQAGALCFAAAQPWGTWLAPSCFALQGAAAALLVAYVAYCGGR